MPLRSETLKAWPPGGWQFFQPETGWQAPTPMVFNFEQQVANIIAMRKQNARFKLATDYLTVARDLEGYTCARIGNNPKYCVAAEGIVADEAQKKTALTFSHPHLSGGDAAAVPVDLRALREWLGAGATPVERELAERRAGVCAGCPENSASPTCPDGRRNAWMDWITGPVAVALKQYVGIKNRMKISTSRDAELGRCLACRCELVLKCHTPLEHIKDNMAPETLARLRSVPHCWVLTEQ